MIELRTLPENARALQDLRELGADLQKKGVVSSLQAATLPLVGTLKARAPDDPKTGGSRLASAINRLQVRGSTVLQSSAGKRTINVPDNVYALVIGPNKGTKKLKVGWLGHILEVGAKAHKIERFIKGRAGGTRFRFARPIKFTRGDGGFAMGPIDHKGFPARDWMGGALGDAESQIDEGFYRGLNRWIAKNGR